MDQTNIKYDNILDEMNGEFSNFIRKHENSVTRESILSFAFPVKKIDIIPKLNTINNNFSDFLFFENFQDNFSFAALNKLESLNFNWNFGSLKDIVDRLKAITVNNWEQHNIQNPPFIIGGVKFDSGRASSEWNDFDVNHLFVPRILLLQKAKSSFLIYNLHPSPGGDYESVKNEFSEIVSLLFDFNSYRQNGKNIITEMNGFNHSERLHWEKLVSRTIRKLDLNFKKVVLARRIELELKNNIDWVTCFNNLEPEFPKCYLFMLKSNDSVFFGASPEKFLTVRDNRIEIDAIAGSASGDSKDIDAELLTGKNINEHKYVIEFIKDALSDYCDTIEIDNQPGIKKLKDVQHLYTKISAKLIFKNDVTNLIETMFPTPAVCGLPKSDAFEAIRETENFDRGLFSGLTGWIDLEMNCEFTVAIRSALYRNKKIFLYAGAGIVEESIPEEEYTETEMKFNTILNLFDEEKTG